MFLITHSLDEAAMQPARGAFRLRQGRGQQAGGAGLGGDERQLLVRKQRGDFRGEFPQHVIVWWIALCRHCRSPIAFDNSALAMAVPGAVRNGPSG